MRKRRGVSFKHVEGYLKWFDDSPDAGDPECRCSFCAGLIGEEEGPVIRFWHDVRLEARFHEKCFLAALGEGVVVIQDVDHRIGDEVLDDDGSEI
jgi:hypothetical protein